MERRQLNPFASANVDHDIKLAIARDLEPTYSSLLHEPVPPNLQRFIERLEQSQSQAQEISN